MSLELERERTVQALCSHSAQDHLTTQELERRFPEVYRASSGKELLALMRGLPSLGPASAAVAPLPLFSVAPAAPPQPEKRYLAFMAEVRIILPPGLHVD